MVIAITCSKSQRLLSSFLVRRRYTSKGKTKKPSKPPHTTDASSEADPIDDESTPKPKAKTSSKKRVTSIKLEVEDTEAVADHVPPSSPVTSGDEIAHEAVKEEEEEVEETVDRKTAKKKCVHGYS